MTPKETSTIRPRDGSEFEVGNGRVISLNGLQQWVKPGPLDGAPTASMLEGLVHQDAQHHGSERGFHLIRPTFTALDPDWSGDPDAAPMWLPRIVVVGDFSSDQPVGPVNESGWDTSVLRMLWYQDDWALPIAPEVRKQIRALDWESLAVDVVNPY